jgi:LacI family transcriptional regulator
VGFNNQDICLMPTPTLTSVDQRIDETIVAAGEVLLPQLGAAPRARPIIKMIEPLLVLRGSTGPARV